MGIKIGDVDLFEEIIETKLGLQAVLNSLARKGIISQAEFDSLKKEALEEFKKEHPSLFKEDKRIK